MYTLALMVSRDSESLFYELLSKQSSVPLKELCKKIPRKMLYKYLTQLKLLQDTTGIEIFKRSASICSITGLPNIVIERRCEICVENIVDGPVLVKFGS
jgi:hypothetical protein